MTNEVEPPLRVDQTMEGFVVYPSRDEGPAFFGTAGLSEEDIDTVKEALRRQRDIGSVKMLTLMIHSQPDRLVRFEDLVNQFRRTDRVTRIRVQIEEIIGT